MDKSGFGQGKQGLVMVSPEMMFGEKDLNLNERDSTAICCAAYCRVLKIPKEYQY